MLPVVPVPVNLISASSALPTLLWHTTPFQSLQQDWSPVPHSPVLPGHGPQTPLDITGQLKLKAKFHTSFGSYWQAHSDSALILPLLPTEQLHHLECWIHSMWCTNPGTELAQKLFWLQPHHFYTVWYLKSYNNVANRSFHTSQMTRSWDNPNRKNCHFNKYINSVRLKGFRFKYPEDWKLCASIHCVDLWRLIGSITDNKSSILGKGNQSFSMTN